MSTPRACARIERAMLTLIVVGLVGLTLALDLLPAVKKRPKKETVVYCLLLAVGFCVLLLYSLDIRVPGPSEGISDAVKALFPVE